MAKKQKTPDEDAERRAILKRYGARIRRELEDEAISRQLEYERAQPDEARRTAS